MKRVRDLDVVANGLVILAGVLTVFVGIPYLVPRPSSAPVPSLGRILPNPFNADYYEIRDFNVFKTDTGWKVAAPLLPPTMPITVYLVVLDEALLNKVKLSDKSYVAQHIPGAGWESPIPNCKLTDFSITPRGYAATAEIGGVLRRYGLMFELDLSSMANESTLELIPDMFTLIVEKSGKELDKTSEDAPVQSFEHH